MPDRLVLMSVKPKYAEMLLAGRKTVEVRRVRPAVEGGDWVLVYASSPKKQLLGAFQVDELYEASPSDLWEHLGAQTGVPHDAFFAYFRGAHMGVGIRVRQTLSFPHPASLDRIRESIPQFQPPQAYRYLRYGTQVRDVLLGLVTDCTDSVSNLLVG